MSFSNIAQYVVLALMVLGVAAQIQRNVKFGPFIRLLREDQAIFSQITLFSLAIQYVVTGLCVWGAFAIGWTVLGFAMPFLLIAQELVWFATLAKARRQDQYARHLDDLL